MKLTSALAVLVIFISFSACKKVNESHLFKLEGSPAWELDGNWQMRGYHSLHLHPSGGQQSSSHDTISNAQHTIKVINDTTVVFSGYRRYSFSSYGGAHGDTLCLFETNSTQAYMEFIPKIFIGGTRYKPTSLKYYYNADSISYFFMDSGVSFHDSLTLFTQ